MGIIQTRNSLARGSSGMAAFSQIHSAPASMLEMLLTAQVLTRPELKSSSTSSFDGTASRRGCSLVCSESSTIRADIASSPSSSMRKTRPYVLYTSRLVFEAAAARIGSSASSSTWLPNRLLSRSSWYSRWAMRFWYSSTRVPFCRAIFSISSSSLRAVRSLNRLATSFTIVTADSGRVSASFIHSSILCEKEGMGVP